MHTQHDYLQGPRFGAISRESRIPRQRSSILSRPLKPTLMERMAAILEGAASTKVSNNKQQICPEQQHTAEQSRARMTAWARLASSFRLNAKVFARAGPQQQ
jgi:hypothetical protein